MSSIKEMAEMMNVSEADVRCLAMSVVNDIKKDKVVEQFLNGTEEFRAKMVRAYIDHACKKMDQFVTKFFSNPEAREAFIKSVFAIS